MKFAIEDREYEFKAEMTIEEAFLLKEKAYVTVVEFGPALDRADPHAIAVLMYLLKRRNGEAVKWEDILKLNIFSFRIIDDSVEAEPSDPTKPSAKPAGAKKSTSAGSTRKGATSATS